MWNIWATYATKIVSKNFQKSPKLDTLLAIDSASKLFFNFRSLLFFRQFFILLSLKVKDYNFIFEPSILPGNSRELSSLRSSLHLEWEGLVGLAWTISEKIPAWLYSIFGLVAGNWTWGIKIKTNSSHLVKQPSLLQLPRFLPKWPKSTFSL